MRRGLSPPRPFYRPLKTLWIYQRFPKRLLLVHNTGYSMLTETMPGPDRMDDSLLASKAWYSTIEGLCTHLHDDRFPELLVSALEQITPLEHAMILAFPDRGQPLHIYNNFPECEVTQFLKTYLEGAYLVDPFCDCCITAERSGIHHIRELVPDLFDSDFFHDYCEQAGFRDEIAIFIRVDATFSIGISLGQFHRSTELTAADLEQLKLVEPMLLALCHQHWQPQRLKSLFNQAELDDSREFGDHLQTAFINFGRDHLSGRECEVIRLIIKGHSSKEIARVLDISPDTVKVHRKRFHAKLQITSQAELFSLFLDAISLLPIGSDEDPLSFYFAEHPLSEIY